MRSDLHLVLAVSLLLGLATQARSQDDAAPVESADADGFASVVGISRGDLLNIRAAASPTGLVIARVPNGSLLKVEECTTASGNLWCKVEDANDAATNGWTPARYLTGYEDRALEAAAAASKGSTSAEITIMSEDTVLGPEIEDPAPSDPRSRGKVASFYTMPLPKSAPAGKSLFDGGDDPRHRGVSGGAVVSALVGLPVVPGEGNDLAPMPLPREAAEEIVPRDQMAAEMTGEQTVEEGGDLQGSDAEVAAATVLADNASLPDVEIAKQQRPTATAVPNNVNDTAKVEKPAAAPIASDAASSASSETSAGQGVDTETRELEPDTPQSRLKEMASTLRHFFSSEDEAEVAENQTPPAETPIETAATSVPEIVAAPTTESSETVTGAVRREGV